MPRWRNLWVDLGLFRGLKKLAELAAGGIKGTLLRFVEAALYEWPTLVVINGLKQELWDRTPAQGWRLVKVCNDASTQQPKIVDVAANGLGGEIGRRQMFDERPETAQQLLAWEEISSRDHPGARPVVEVATIVEEAGRGRYL